jgi:hypothetical protein
VLVALPRLLPLVVPVSISIRVRLQAKKSYSRLLPCLVSPAAELHMRAVTELERGDHTTHYRSLGKMTRIHLGSRTPQSALTCLSRPR